MTTSHDDSTYLPDDVKGTVPDTPMSWKLVPAIPGRTTNLCNPSGKLDRAEALELSQAELKSEPLMLNIAPQSLPFDLLEIAKVLADPGVSSSRTCEDDGSAYRKC